MIETINKLSLKILLLIIGFKVLNDMSKEIKELNKQFKQDIKLIKS